MTGTEFWDVAQEKMEEKGVEHGGEGEARYQFSDYCPFGLMSASTFVHREALRVCASVARRNVEAVKEHLIDTAVFCALVWEYIKKEERKERRERRVKG